MEIIISGILICNLVATFLYVYKRKESGQSANLAWFFISFPMLGFLTYFIPLYALRGFGNDGYDRDDLVKRLDIEKERAMPSVEKELDVIPVGDAMAISSNFEKRKLILEQLKKDINANYKVVLPASSDEDSESAHYVAAAKMEVYRRKQARLVDVRREWEQDSSNHQKWTSYLNELSLYIESGLLAEKEAQIYKTEYCTNVLEVAQNKKIGVSGEEYTNCLSYLVSLKQYELVENLWTQLDEQEKDEKSYWIILQMYHDRLDEDRFYHYLDELGKSKIKLSAEGLKKLRYWKERRQ